MSGRGGDPVDPARLIAAAADQDDVASSVGSTIADRAAHQDIDDRARLTATVSVVFLLCLPASLLALLILSFVQAGSAAAAVNGIVEILKSVLLPIVTLVLGYYFARSRG